MHGMKFVHLAPLEGRRDRCLGEGFYVSSDLHELSSPEFYDLSNLQHTFYLDFVICQFCRTFNFVRLTRVALSFPSIDSLHHSTRGDGSPETFKAKLLLTDVHKNLMQFSDDTILQCHKNF